MNEETKKQIEQLINQRKEWLIESLVKFCVELVEEDNWINVKDDLPKEDTNVLVSTSKFGITEMGYYLKGHWFDTHVGKFKDGVVTHWQPLPKSPKTIKP